MTNERTVYCPKCGKLLRRISRIADTYNKNMGIFEYDMYCDACDTNVNIEDRSSFEQEGKILVTFA